MNRPLKFRVWSIKENKFYSVFPFKDAGFTDTVAIGNNGAIVHLDSGRFSYCEPYNQNYVVEQFTGLTDRNGRDVYEGDIIKSESNQEVAGKVFYNSLAADYEVRLKSLADGGPLCCYRIGHSPYVVVGNIHENPTLLPA